MAFAKNLKMTETRALAFRQSRIAGFLASYARKKALIQSWIEDGDDDARRMLIELNAAKSRADHGLDPYREGGL